MAFGSVESLLHAAEGRPLWEAVLLDDLRDRGVERSASWEKMAGLWAAMRGAICPSPWTLPAPWSPGKTG